MSSSSFERFSVAKRHITRVFNQLSSHVNSCSQLVNESSQANEEMAEMLAGHCTQVEGILEVMARNNMKAVLFARTSSGKSTLINAVLGSRILPTGLGHITNCFIQVEGGNIPEPQLFTEESPEPQSIQGINDLANALNSSCLGDNSLVRIVWPNAKCPVLGQGVVLVDSPGVDVADYLDEWIDKHCLDADVFILVANSESTLMNSEKKFFHRVSAKLSKPNILVVHNRWDASMYESVDSAQLVREQHTQRSTAFLVQELGTVSSEAAAREHIFFVSSREVLQSRLDPGMFKEMEHTRPGFKDRYQEFEAFEEKFGECLTTSAIHTKFSNVTQRGEDILAFCQQCLDQLCQNQWEHRSQMLMRREELSQQLLRLQEGQSGLKEFLAGKVASLPELVSHKLRDQLSLCPLLNNLAETFKPSSPFNPEDISNDPNYCKELQEHILNGLNSSLRNARVNIAKSCMALQKSFVEKVAELLGEDPAELMNKATGGGQSSKLDYDFDLDTRIFGNFRPQLEFKFVMFELVSPDVINQAVSHVVKAQLGLSDNLTDGLNKTIWIAATAALGSYVRNKHVLRAVVGTGAGFTALYYYQKHQWNTTGKELALRSQLVGHSTHNADYVLNFIVEQTAARATEYLKNSFSLLKKELDSRVATIQEELETFESKLNHFESVVNRAQTLREEAETIKAEMEAFIQLYINSQS